MMKSVIYCILTNVLIINCEAEFKSSKILSKRSDENIKGWNILHRGI
jgi:hypothetical protein